MAPVAPQQTQQIGSIATRALLMSFKATTWSAAKHDRKVAREVAEKHGSNEEMGAYRKKLLAPDALKKISGLVAQIREVHRSLTMPWLDSGPRLLLTENFLRYEARINPLEDEIRAAVDDLIADWDAHKAAAKQQLNGLYDEADYPPVSEMKARFTVSHSSVLINSAADARIGASQEVADAIRAKAQADERAALEGAMADVRERIEEVVGRMAERCAIYGHNAEGKLEGAFRDTLVSNVRDLVAVLPVFDALGGGKGTAFAQKVEHLCRYDAQTLRDSERARAEVAAEAQAIVDHVSDLF